MDHLGLSICLVSALKLLSLASAEIVSIGDHKTSDGIWAVGVKNLTFQFDFDCGTICSYTLSYSPDFSTTVSRDGLGRTKCPWTSTEYNIVCPYSAPFIYMTFSILRALPASYNQTTIIAKPPSEEHHYLITLRYGDINVFQPVASAQNGSSTIGFNDVVEFNCNATCYLQSTFTATLQFDATWSPATDLCQKATCPLQLCNNCTWVDDNLLTLNCGETRTVECASGFNSTGPAQQTMTCSYNESLKFDLNCTMTAESTVKPLTSSTLNEETSRHNHDASTLPVTPTAIPAANNTRLKNGPIAAAAEGSTCLVCCIGCAVYVYRTRDRVDTEDSTRNGGRNHEEEKKKKKKQKRKIRLIVLSAFLVLCLILCIVFILLLTVTSESLTCSETDLGQCAFSAAETVGLVLGICIIVALFVVIIADYSCSCCGSFYDLFLTKQNKPEERSMMSNL